MKKTQDRTRIIDSQWPMPLRIKPNTVIIIVLLWLAFAWFVFLSFDIFGWFASGTNSPMWRLLFNDHPVEWTQWFLLAFSVFVAGFLSAVIYARKQIPSAKFFLLFGIGLGLMLIEEAGDIRHTISPWVRSFLGDEIAGLSYRVVSEVPYFALLASVPAYAVLRYGIFVWREYLQARWLFLSGIALYAVAAVSSALRHLNDFYIRVGAWVDTRFFAGRFPVPDDMTQERAHFFVVDGVIEESVELLAITMILAGLLAVALQLQQPNKQPAATKKPTGKIKP